MPTGAARLPLRAGRVRIVLAACYGRQMSTKATSARARKQIKPMTTRSSRRKDIGITPWGQAALSLGESAGKSPGTLGGTLLEISPQVYVSALALRDGGPFWERCQSPRSAGDASFPLIRPRGKKLRRAPR